MSICILNVISLSLVALSETIGRLGAVFVAVAGVVLASAISSLCSGALVAGSFGWDNCFAGSGQAYLLFSFVV